MGLFARFKRKHDDRVVVSDEERSPRLGLRRNDLVLMNTIANRTSDLSRPRHFLFFLYATTEDAGQRMASEARARGFDVSIGEPLPDYSSSWSVRCETQEVLTADFVRESVDFFEDLARRHDGEYDGWEAEAT